MRFEPWKAACTPASTSSGQCYALTTRCPVSTSAANRGYTPGFAAAPMAKDLRLSQEAARTAGAAIPLGAAAQETFARCAENRGRCTDYAGVIDFLWQSRNAHQDRARKAPGRPETGPEHAPGN
ncbi:NAD-binding protein [Xanthobacter autotrophicus]|uniref:NAD-binding protein n=1 Tax=Xanthobacter autotrophicus TaxID=280 RepID=UPI003727D737